jgi:hypothetical protein
VYLTEKISRWYNYNGKPFAYAFLDYIIEDDVDLQSGDSITIPDNYPAGGLDPVNLMVIAVVFSDESVTKEQQPGEINPYEFQGYYADATVGTEVVEGGNLPPEVGIIQPKALHIHCFDRPGRMTPLRRNTVLIGKTTIQAFAEDDTGIDRVEIKIDGDIVETLTEEPYEYTFRKIKMFKRLVRQHTIAVTAYDIEGKSSTVELEVLTFFL